MRSSRRVCRIFSLAVEASIADKKIETASHITTQDSTADEFLDLPRHILEFATTEKHNKCEISVAGRSGCRLSINT